MSSSLRPPPTLSACAPFLQRAEEVSQTQPVVAYHCRTYAAEVCVTQLDPADSAGRAFVKELLTRLESDKAALRAAEPPAGETAEESVAEGQLAVEGFALQVFLNADTAERSGVRDGRVAKAFYAAAVFFEVLNQFGPLDDAIVEKQKYAKVKAAEISKEIKARKNDPNHDSTNKDRDPAEKEVPREEVEKEVPKKEVPKKEEVPKKVVPKKEVKEDRKDNSNNTAPPVASDCADPVGVSKAQKHARWAVSALQYYDVPTAITQLQESLAILKALPEQ